VKPIPLRAGGLHMIFDPRRACLRYVRLGDHEIVRAIYGAIRDKDWNTIGPHVLNLQQESNKDHFRLSFDAECKSPGIDFFGRVLSKATRGEIRLASMAKRVPPSEPDRNLPSASNSRVRRKTLQDRGT
jgi:hypothetical protein